MAKLLKATISGTYRASNKDTIDFEDVVGYVPLINKDVAIMHIIGRYAPIWIKAKTKKDGEREYPKRIEDMRQVFVDSLVEVDGDELSYVGKDIKEMTYDELQDLATAKDLREIPLPKELSGVSLREMRAIAYSTYSEKILNLPKIEDASSMFGDLPALIVDGDKRVETAQKITNEEIIAMEQEAKQLDQTPKEQMTLEQLQELAKKKNIPYHPNIGRDALYAKLFDGSSE